MMRKLIDLTNSYSVETGAQTYEAGWSEDGRVYAESLSRQQFLSYVGTVGTTYPVAFAPVEAA